MANNKSAEKRIEITERNRLRNRFYKSSVRTQTKSFLKKLENFKILKNVNEKEELKKTLAAIYSLIDKGTKRNVFHKNTAARKKSQLAAALKSSQF